MPDFAPNYTARYRLHYNVLGLAHTMTWRVASSVTDPSGVADKMGLFLSDLAENLWSNFTIIGADFAPADSDIFLPAVMPDPVTGGASVASFHQTDKSFAISFVGRSDHGQKARFFLYGTSFAVNVRDAQIDDWKITSAESPTSISDAIVRLNETSPALVGNDDHTVVWYEYVNCKYNDRWVRRQRRG